MVMDNLGTHTQPDVKRWFGRHPRFKLHFTPKGASWMNMVEGWFPSSPRSRFAGTLSGTQTTLIRAINEFVVEYQKDPRPFVWTVDAGEILRKVARLRRLEATGQ